MPHLIRYCLAFLLLLPAWSGAASLTFSVIGLEAKPELQKNVLAWLGDDPESVRERLNFVVSARDRVERSLQALGYYRPDIGMDVQRTDPVWQLVISVDPGDPVRIRDIDIQVMGAAANDPEFTRLIADVSFALGDVLHHGLYEDFRNSLLSLGQRRGYLDATITSSKVAVEVAAGTADVSIQYDSGRRYRFGALIHDEEMVDYALLDSLRTFHQGDYFEQSKLQEFQSELQRTNYFSSVIVLPVPEQAQDGEVPIAVKMQAARSHSFDVGVGYSTDTEERLSLTWRTPKINRHGHSQVTRLVYSPVNPSGRFTYTIPLTHPLNDILQLWARTEDNEFGDLDSRQDELGVRREIRKGKWIHGYSLRGLNESWDVLQLDATNDYLLLGATLSRRVSSGSIVDPKSGFSQLYTLEVGNGELGSDIDLARFTANLRLVFTPLPQHRVVSRAGFGVVEIASGDRTELAPSLNFFAGGNQSIRGFAYQSIGNEIEFIQENGKKKTLVVGGDRLVTASLEYQYYFTDSWRGAVFSDVGDAFDEGEFDLNYSAGFGIHYITPVGAIRVEMANSLSDKNPEWYLHLTIGAEF
ncbi:MAG: outer membrane protein assembly factor [Gammaproteobacteria bacterium]|nr:MAG: outer membrane protein assembly factor [Gammaproteobacteria bacterium]